MKSEEAIEQITYLKELTEKTQLNAAYGYPFYILWGIIVIIGYCGRSIIPLCFITWQWTILWITGAIISGFILLKQRKKYNYTLLLKRIGLQCLILIILDLLIFGLFIHYKIFELLNAYWPFQFGIIYIISSVHMSRSTAYIGLWIIITALASFFIPSPFQNIWLAISCGGGVFVTGIFFRSQVKKAEEKLV